MSVGTEGWNESVGRSVVGVGEGGRERVVGESVGLDDCGVAVGAKDCGTSVGAVDCGRERVVGEGVVGAVDCGTGVGKSVGVDENGVSVAGESVTTRSEYGDSERNEEYG